MNWSKQNWRAKKTGGDCTVLPEARCPAVTSECRIAWGSYTLFDAHCSKVPFHRPCRPRRQSYLQDFFVAPPREAHRMTNKEPGHLRIELPGFNVLNCKHLRDIIFQLPQVRKRQFHIQLWKILVAPCIEVVDREFCIALAWTHFLLVNSAQTLK